MKTTEALKDLLYRIADDELIIGHRNSEWTGLGPILEEDLAFSSMAQDELGHAFSYYKILQELGEGDPDQLAFNRNLKKFKSCHFVEYPIGDYAFSLVRHFLYDYAENVRLEALTKSSFAPLAELSNKLLREEKYHVLHAKTWIEKLGNSENAESRNHLQNALNIAFPMAFGMFEESQYSTVLAEEKIQPLESDLKEKWLEKIKPILNNSNLAIPEMTNVNNFFGGRKGNHSIHLESLLKEMSEVFSIDPDAKW